MPECSNIRRTGRSLYLEYLSCRFCPPLTPFTELRWKFNPQIFTLGWELPARHWEPGDRTGDGIPADAREKPGSGGQLIAFVPSLDLVVTRRTGSSGEGAFEEYLRRACATVLAE